MPQTSQHAVQTLCYMIALTVPIEGWTQTAAPSSNPASNPASTSVSPPALNTALPASVGRWMCRWGRGGLMAQYDQVPLLRGGNVQLFTEDGRGLYGAGAHPPACRIEPLADGGRAYITHYHYEGDTVPAAKISGTSAPGATTADANTANAANRRAVFDAEQRIEVHASKVRLNEAHAVEGHAADRITFEIRARWSGAQSVRLEWNPLRVWAYALVGAQYTSQINAPQIAALQTNTFPLSPFQTQTKGDVTPAPQKDRPQAVPLQGEAQAILFNAMGRIGWKPRIGALAVTQVSPGWQRLRLTHTAIGDVTLTASMPDEEGAEDAANVNRAVAQNAAQADAVKSDATANDRTRPVNGALPVLYDGRGDANLSGDRVFWGGIIGAKILPDGAFARRIILSVAPSNPLPVVMLSSRPSIAADPASAEHNTPLSAPTALPARLRKLTPDRTAPHSAVRRPPLLVPTPKMARFSGEDFVLGRTLTLCALPPDENQKRQGSGIRLIPVVPYQAAGPRVVAELGRLGEELRAQTGTTVRWTRSPEKCGLNVYMAPAASSVRASSTVEQDEQEDKQEDKKENNTDRMQEGYRLLVRPGRILLIAHDQAGAFYGLQTLRQLLARRSNGAYAFRGADIRDWPSLRFRGAHIFVGRNALPFHKKLIERIFARFKMNALVIECEYTAWKSHPELHVLNSMPPDDLRQEVAFARARFLEPIPLVNSLGHSQWLFANKQHLDLCEDPARPYAYNVSDPATYRLLFDIYGETLDIFKPRYFHIGHDEVKIPGEDTFGRYPARPENIQKGVTRLFVDDTNRLADWLRARGARTMLWADMLLHESEGTDSPEHLTLSAANAPTRDEAQARRAQMPRDAIVADWRYAAGSEQRNGLRALTEAGFETLGCAWYEPGNIAGLARQAAQNHAFGTLQTTWAGYDSNESLLDTEYKQFTAYVLAAQAAWTGGEVANDAGSNKGFDAADVFARAYRNEGIESTEGAAGVGQTGAGWRLDLQAAANAQVVAGQADSGFPLASYASGHPNTNGAQGLASPRSLPIGIMLRGLLDPLTANANVRDASSDKPGEKAQAAAVTAPGNTPRAGRAAKSGTPATTTLRNEAIVLPVRARANALVFEHACAYGVENGTLVAAYTVVYADGRRVEIPLRYGYETRALDDAAVADSFSTSAHAIFVGDSAVTLRRLRWTNPHPDAPIDRLEFRTRSSVAAPILFGVTGLR